MKKLTMLLAMVFAISTAMAQDYENNNGVRTVFSNHGNNGGYGAFSLGYGRIDNSDAFIGGARGGFIFDHKLAIGVGGYGFVNNLDNNNYYLTPTNNELYLAGGYGGILIEPIVGGQMPVHVSFPVILGVGGVALTSDDWDWDWEDRYDRADYDSDVFFVFEPGVELEFNLARFFRLAAAMTYRFTSEVELTANGSTYVDPDALQGFNFSMVFKFGKF